MFGVSYVYISILSGRNSRGRAIYDGDAMIASGGRLLASSKRFSFADFKLVSALVDVDLTAMSQARTSEWHPKLENRIHIPFEYPDIPPCKNTVIVALWEESLNIKEEEFTRAVSLGLFDYLRKSHSGGFVMFQVIRRSKILRRLLLFSSFTNVS